MSQWMDNWGLPFIIIISGALLLAWGYVLWLFSGYILGWLNAPIEGRWIAQLVITILIMSIMMPLLNRIQRRNTNAFNNN